MRCLLDILILNKPRLLATHGPHAAVLFLRTRQSNGREGRRTKKFAAFEVFALMKLTINEPTVQFVASAQAKDGIERRLHGDDSRLAVVSAMFA